MSTTTSTSLACAPLPDTDGDGIGDACDPCPAGAVVTDGKITIRGLDTPPGDDKLKFKGIMQLPFPFTPALDPITRGVRVLLYDANNAVMLDATIPGGAFDDVTQRGWLLNESGNVYIYKVAGRQAVLIDGIKKVVLRDRSFRTPGQIKFVVVGRNGAFPMPTIPVRGTLVVDPPMDVAGQCGDAKFPGPIPVAPACTLPTPGFLICR